MDSENEEIDEKISELEDQIENITAEEQEENPDKLDELNSDIDQLQDQRRENEDEMDQLQDEMTELLDVIEPPPLGSTLEEWIMDMTGGDTDLIVRSPRGGNTFDYIQYIESPDRVMRELERLEPTEEMFQVDEDQLMDAAERILSENLGFEFTTGGVSPGPGDTEWLITTDASVDMDMGGIEVVSPPMPMPEFIEKAEEFIDFIQYFGSTDSSTGLHVHMSIEGRDLDKDLDAVKLFLFHDEDYVYKFFKERKGNSMAMSIKSKLEQVDYNFEDLYKILKVNKLEKDLETSKYFGINMSAIDENHIEFRYLGGTDYETKWNEIKSVIGKNAYDLKLAVDPDFKRQEYIKKLNRMINRFLNRYKEDYFRVLLAKYIQEKVFKEFGRSQSSAEVISFLNDYRSGILSRLEIDIDQVYRNFRALDYTKKEYENLGKHLFTTLDLRTNIEDDDPELYNFIEKIIKNPKLVKKGFSQEFRIRSKFLK